MKTTKQENEGLPLDPARGNQTKHVIANMTKVVKAKGKRWRPYASALDCPRKVWFFANTEEGARVNPPTALLYQEIGNSVEGVIVDSFEHHNNLLGKQVKLPNPPKSFGINVGGYIDMVGIDANGAIAAYEIKTATKLPNEPKAPHLSQALVYAALGGFDIVHLVYVSREVQHFPDPNPLIKVFTIDTSPDVIQGVLGTVAYACYGAGGKVAPPRPAHFRKHRECQYCDFQTRCWDDSDTLSLHPLDALVLQRKADEAAIELVKMRKFFYVESLSNAKGSAPAYAIPLLDKEILKANAALRI